MKKIFIVTGNIGKSPAGIVTEEMINGLLKAGAELQIVCNRCYASLEGNVVVDEFPEKKEITQLHKILYILLNRDPRWTNWISRVAGEARKKADTFNPDFILGIAAGQTDRIPALASKVSELCGKPLHLHAVDAIPSPEAWGVNPYLRKAIQKSVKLFFKNADSLSLTNDVMLDYQLDIAGRNKTERTFTFYNPYRGHFIHGDSDAEKPYALYLGSLNVVRHARQLVAAMKLISITHPEFRLFFVGTDREIIESYFAGGDIPENITVFDWTDDPETFIRKASVLVDIDIDRAGDVFMSSKLVRYLNSDIPILSITQTNSPASKILSNAGEGIQVVPHQAAEIHGALTKLLKRSKETDLNKRLQIVKLFDLEKNISKLLDAYR